MTQFDHAYSNPRSLYGRFSTWFDNDYVCVLTIGKTASSAIIEALLQAGVKAFQIHSICRTPQSYLFFNDSDHYIVKNALYRLKISAWIFAQKGKKRQFITTFRDPFERNLSAFFEQIWKIDGLSVDNEEFLIRGFEEKGPHDATKNWFKENIQSKFGLSYEDVNLTEEPYRVSCQHGKEFLFLKYERKDCWSDAISDFVSKPILLERRNDSSKKHYADKIKHLKEVWRPSRQIVERSVDVDLWNALYTADEKKMIRDKWHIPMGWLE